MSIKSKYWGYYILLYWWNIITCSFEATKPDYLLFLQAYKLPFNGFVIDPSDGSHTVSLMYSIPSPAGPRICNSKFHNECWMPIAKYHHLTIVLCIEWHAHIAFSCPVVLHIYNPVFRLSKFVSDTKFDYYYYCYYRNGGVCVIIVVIACDGLGTWAQRRLNA